MSEYLTFFDFDREQAKFIELMVLKIKSIYKCRSGRGIALNHTGALHLSENDEYEKYFINIHAEAMYLLNRQELNIILGYAVLRHRFIGDWIDWSMPGTVNNQNEYLSDETEFSYCYILLAKHFNRTIIASAFIKFYIARTVALGLFTHIKFESYKDLVAHVASNTYERILSSQSLEDINSWIRPDSVWVEDLTPMFKDFGLSFESVKEFILQSEFLNKDTFAYFEEQQSLLYRQYGKVE